MVAALNERLTRAKNKLEAALRETHSGPALRRRVNDVYSDLDLFLHAFAPLLENTIDETEEEAGDA